MVRASGKGQERMARTMRSLVPTSIKLIIREYPLSFILDGNNLKSCLVERRCSRKEDVIQIVVGV